MKTVQIRGLTLGQGRQRSACPLSAPPRRKSWPRGARIARLRGKGADLCEWRIDWYEGVYDREALRSTGLKLAKALEGMPLLCTFRTEKEGGHRACDEAFLYGSGL